MLYNSWKNVVDYDLAGIDNLDEATIDGNPSWYTINCSYSRQINNDLYVKFGIENILDAHYKVFASGISASGRNLIVSLQANF